MEQPSFGGNPGEPVPLVDPHDLKAVWGFFKEAEAQLGQARATGLYALRRVCRPGADIEALSYRAMMLNVLTRHAKDQLAPWTKEGELSDAVFGAAATTPMEWIGVGIEHHGLPFDFQQFMHRLCEETDNG